MKIDRLLRTDGVWKISLSTEDEQDISRLWIHEYQMRFGTAQLKLGGIAGVGTNEEQRNKGYSRHVMEDSTGVHDREWIRCRYAVWYSGLLPQIWLCNSATGDMGGT